MGKVLETAGATATLATGVTRYSVVNGPNTVGAVQNRAQVTMRSAGVINNLSVYSPTNGTTSPSSVSLQDNGSSTSLSVSIAAGATGLFQDLVNSASIAAADLVNYVSINGGGGTLALTYISSEFSATTNTVIKLIACSDTNFSTDSVTRFIPYCGVLVFNTSEANCEAKFRTAGTLKNVAIFLRTNARITTSTLTSRKNGANGNISISIGAGITGVLEDTTNSDTIATTDLGCVALTTSTGGGNINITSCGTDFETTDSKFQIVGGTGAGTSLTAATRFFSFSNTSQAQSTEVNGAGECPFAFTASNLGAYCSTNAASGASTVDLRVNSASSSVTLSVGSAATGWFEDTTNSASIAANDNACVRIVSGAGGAILWHTITLVGATASAAVGRSYGIIM